MGGAGHSTLPHPRATSPWTVRLIPGVPLPRFCSVGHSAVSTSNTKGASYVDLSVAPSSLRSSTMNLCNVFNRQPGLVFCRTAIVAKMTRLGNRSLLPCHAPAKKEPIFTDGRFDAVATCHPEGHRVRDGEMVSTK